MRTWDHACVNSRVDVHVLFVKGALRLDGHVVIGVVLGFSAEFFPSEFCSPLMHL